MSGPLLLPTWEQLGVTHPAMVATMSRYLQQVACVLRPGSVSGADLALRSFTTFLVETSPAILSTADLTRRHVEEYKPWLAKRPGQNKARLTPATLAHRLGTLRMFFIRIDEWGWDEAPARIPMFAGDLPRQDHPLPKALDDAAAAKLLRAAQNDKRLLVRVAVEVLLRTGLRVSEFTALRSDAIVQTGAGPWLHVPVGKLREDRYLPLHPQLVDLIRLRMRPTDQRRHRPGQRGPDSRPTVHGRRVPRCGRPRLRRRTARRDWVGALEHGSTVSGRIPRPGPRFRRPRRLEAGPSGRRRGIRNPEEGAHAVSRGTADGSVCRVDGRGCRSMPQACHGAGRRRRQPWVDV